MDIKGIIAEIEKFTGIKGYVGDHPDLIVERIPFGIPQLDLAIGGGIPKGRISLLQGDPSTGKTFLTQQIIRSAQRMGLNVIFYNAEQKYDPDWFVRTGVDTKQLVVVQGNIAEGVLDSVIHFIGEQVGLVIIDSLAALVPISESEDPMEQQTMGLQARIFSKAMRKIVRPLSLSKSCVILVNQLRSTIGRYVTDTSPGGRAPNFYSSLTLNIRRGEWITEASVDGIENRIGFHMVVRSVKNTLAPPWKEVDLPFYFDGYVDIVESIFELAIQHEVIAKSGAWFTAHDGTRHQGRETAIDYYRGDRDRLRELSDAIAGRGYRGEDAESSETEEEESHATQE